MSSNDELSSDISSSCDVELLQLAVEGEGSFKQGAILYNEAEVFSLSILILGSLSTDVFEPRTSTGSRNFSSLMRVSPFPFKKSSCKC